MKVVLPYYTDERAWSRRRPAPEWATRWIRTYEASGTPFEPLLLTDGTPPPPGWTGGVVVHPDPLPPLPVNPLARSDWMTAGAFALVGPCLRLDTDCYVRRSLAHLADVGPLALPVYPEPYRERRIHPGCDRPKLCGNCVVLRCDVRQRFTELLTEYHPTLGDWCCLTEVVLTRLVAELGGVVLDDSHNRLHVPGDRDSLRAVWHDPTTRIVHMLGNRKLDLDGEALDAGVL